GGISALFPVPAYQKDTPLVPPVNPGAIAGRGLPDAAADADPQTGYYIVVYGNRTVNAGTSAATPLWAALIARINQLLGVQAGFLNPLIYTRLQTAGIFHDITLG